MSKTTIALYRTGEGWRWQMRDARNGRIIGASTEGYVRQSACLRNLERVSGIFMRCRRGASDYDFATSLGYRQIRWAE